MRYGQSKSTTSAVRVAMVMQAGKIMAVWFEQTDKASTDRISVKEVTYRWNHNEGAARIVNFAVTDGANCYELSFNSLDFTWRLSVAVD